MRRREQLVGIVRVISSETSVRDVAVIGDQPEALLLSVLFADAGVGNVLVGPFEPLSGRVFSSIPVDQARRLLGLHVNTRSGEHPELDHEGNDIAKVAVLDIEGGEEGADAEGREQN